jgi:hypothetical protein
MTDAAEITLEFRSVLLVFPQEKLVNLLEDISHDFNNKLNTLKHLGLLN